MWKNFPDSMKNCAAIFDLDGVVIDSGREHLKSWEMLAKSRGRTLPENFLRDTFGMRNVDIIPKILRWTDNARDAAAMSEEKEEYYRSIVRSEGVALVPGVLDFLKELSKASVLCAVGSSTPVENLKVVFDRLGIGGYFAASVGMEDVQRGKPDPQVFLEAAVRLDVPPENSCVFEDSLSGIEAAEAAGMKRVAVATTRPAEFWRERGLRNESKMVNAIVRDFDSFPLDKFFGLFRRVSNGKVV